MISILGLQAGPGVRNSIACYVARNQDAFLADSLNIVFALFIVPVECSTNAAVRIPVSSAHAFGGRAKRMSTSTVEHQRACLLSDALRSDSISRYVPHQKYCLHLKEIELHSEIWLHVEGRQQDSPINMALLQKWGQRR